MTLGLRPESFSVSSDGSTGPKMAVTLVEGLWADAFVYGTLPGDRDEDRPFVVRFDGRVPPRIGGTIAPQAPMIDLSFRRWTSRSRVRPRRTVMVSALALPIEAIFSYSRRMGPENNFGKSDVL